MSATKTAIYRNSQERGKTRLDWLESYHTFSFGDYFDPRFHQFGALRVINDDVVAPAGGFGTHGHRDMEIVTVVLDGAVEHQDSMGNGSIIRPGDVQRMTAGTGVTHSEFNPSATTPLRLLQIWILPERKGLQPGYEQKSFTDQALSDGFRVIASPDGREDSVTIHQDAFIYKANLVANQAVRFETRPGRQYWLQVATGFAQWGDRLLETGDGLGLIGSDEALTLTAVDGNTQILLFDLQAES